MKSLQALVMLVVVVLTAGQSQANPTGGTVVAGQAQIGPGSHGTLTITQGSNHAIINWNDFSINAGELTRFVQPNSASAVLNRVTGGNPSALLGKLEGNGSIFLINPNGVLVGPSGVINTGGSFVASTRDIANEAFLAGGDLRLQGGSNSGVENLGFIKSDTGDVILVGRTVRNAGAIEAAAGAAGLAAGDDVLLSATATDRLSVRVTLSGAQAGTGVDNTGTVKAAQAQLAAAGGDVYALAINNGGVVEATGFSRRADGRIVLGAAGGDIAVSGKLAARNTDGSGGTILVGGGYQGQDEAVPNARTTTIAATATLDADATAGDGGRVIVWADERTDFHGSITARGGATAGNGGFVEVSGKQDLLFKGAVDTRAPAGTTGTLLLDPANVTVDVTSLAVGTGANALSMSDLSQQLQTNNVTISTSTRPGTDAGDITFIGTTSGLFHFPNALTFNADRDILFNAPLTIAATNTQGAITFNAGRDIAINQPLNFIATSQGSNSTNATVGAAGTSFAFGAVTFAAANDLYLNAVLGITAASTGGNAADAADFSSGGSGAGGAGGNITFGTFTLSAGDEVLIRNNIDVNATSTGGNGGRGFYAGPADPGLGATTLGAGGAGGAIMMGELRLESATNPASSGKRLIVQSSNGATGTPAALTFDYTSKGGEGGDKAAGGAGGAGGAITTSGIKFEANDGGVWMSEGTTLALNVRSEGGTGGDGLGLDEGNLIPFDLKVLALGGAGGAVNAGDTILAGRIVKLYAQSLDLAATLQSGLGGQIVLFGGFYTGGTGGNAGQAHLGTLRFAADEAIYDTPLLTRSTASAVVPPTGALRYASGAANAADATASPFKLTAGSGVITLGAHGVGSSVFYSDNTIHMIAGADLGATGSAISTKQALFLVADNQHPANPDFDTTFDLDLTGSVIQAGPGATQQTVGSFGAHIPDYVRLYGVQPSAVALGTFVPANTFTSANYYYGVGPLAGLVPGLYYKNIILRDPLTVTASSHTLTYGGFSALPAFSSTYSGFVNGNTINDFTLPTYTTAAAVGANAGTYTLTPGGMTGPANYSFNYVAGTITINPAPLTVMANAASKLYGAALPTFGVTVTGLVNGDSQSTVVTAAPGTTATAASNAGTYTITPGATLNTNNYTLTQNNGALTITPVALTVTASDTTRTYGAGNPTFATTVTGLVNGDQATTVVNLNPTTTATAGSNIGSYTIAPGATLNTGNYTLTQNSGTLTIDTATLNVRADDATKLYAAPMPTLTGTALNLVNGNTQSSVVSFAPTVAGATASSNVGTYVITPNPTLLGATPNYALGTVTNGTLTISPATLNVAANNASKVYGAALPVFGGTALNLVNGDAQGSVVSFAPTTAATAGSNAGTYTITANPTLTSANYTLGTIGAGTLTITQAPLIITADNLSRLYGFANPALTATFNGLVNGDTAAAVSGLSLATSATPASAAGNYPITNAGALSALNYAITFNPGTLVVGSPAPLTITADNRLLTYGFSALPAFTATAAGLVGGDTAAVITGLQFATTASLGANVGNYSIVPSGASAPANYIINYLNGTLTVQAATLNVAANNATKTYGAALPGLGGTAMNLVNGDVQGSVVSFAPTTTATAGSNVGTYTITPNATLLGATPNYTLGTQAAGTLTISPAVLNVAANDVGKTYGAALPAFTGTVTGLVNGDTATSVVALGFGTTATAGSNVGTYTITPSASLFGLTPNYTLGALTQGTLTVNRAPLTITADSFSRALAAANPAFTASYGGLVNGDTAAVVTGLALTTAATPASVAGTYAITPSSATAANYAISYVPGSLIVRGLLGLTLTAADATRFYGDANPAFSLKSIDGLLTGDSLTSVQFRTAATLGSNVGRYAITPFGAVIATAQPREYDISYLPGTLTINPAVLTVSLNGAMLHHSARNWQSIGGLESVATTADSLTATSRYVVNGGGADTFTYTISGFKNTADVGRVDLAGAPAFTYGELTTTMRTPIYVPGRSDPVGYTDLVIGHGPGPVMSQGGLRLTGAAAGNYAFEFKGYAPDRFSYVPNTALTLTTLAADAYPDSKLILPGILLYEPLPEGSPSRGGGLGNVTNYYNQAELAGLAPGYETNWAPGSPVGAYWTLPTLTGLNSGISDPIAGQSYDLSLPFYFPDLANPGREFAVTKIRAGIVNVIARGQEPQGIKLLVQHDAGTVYAQEINVGLIGAFGVPVAAQDVLYNIVDRMLTEAKIDVGPNRVQGVAQWILANGNSAEMRTALTAYMTQEAIEIVTSGRPRTAGEQVFLDSLTNQINQNRAAAANEALAAYNQWKSDQAAFRENMRGYGALLNFGDRIPPEILALAQSQVPSEQILKVSGAVTGAMAGAGGVAMGAILQSKNIMLAIMPHAARAVANGVTSGVSIAGGVAGAAPILNVVATLATIGMAAERLISADADQKAFDKAIAALGQPTTIESALGQRAVLGAGLTLPGQAAAPSYKDQTGMTWEFTRTQDNLALMAAVTATIDTGRGGIKNSSLGGRQ